MSIQKHEYELSVWSETLGDNGQKIEKKEYIIGAHDMSYLGRATDIKLESKLNGTHTLTFQLPDRYFDSEKGEYVRNEFVDSLFNERKIKLKFMGQWYEFYIKSVNDIKHFKSYMKKYNCTDAFIDELSRNGYGITFDTELYNNVEEIGTFSRVILEDSIWDYAPEHNWGDFTEYLEEKLFKIPVGGDLFPEFVGHKLTYKIDAPREGEFIENVFTHEKRDLELGDDLAAAKDGKGGYFWDAQDGTMPLMEAPLTDIPNDGYIYVPYSQLEFCYKTTSTDVNNQKVFAATEEVQYYDDKSYAIAPNTVDPTALIQFIAIPPGAKIEVDEAGLIVNKDYTYVMTVEEWNTYIDSHWYYKFLPESNNGEKDFINTNSFDYNMAAMGNMAAYYEGYLDKIGDLEVINGKKISISDRTEVNITDEIDQYVKVYKEHFNNEDFEDLYVNPDNKWKSDEENEIDYRVCSKTETRQVVPQLARNYLQNGTKIKTVDGWEPQQIYDGADSYQYTNLQTYCGSYQQEELTEDFITTPQETYLKVIPCHSANDTEVSISPEHNTLINFGIVGQEKKIIKDQIYCIGIKIGANDISSLRIKIGEGAVKTQGEYSIDNYIELQVSNLVAATPKKMITLYEKQKNVEMPVTVNVFEGYMFIRFNNNIDNPYFAIVNDSAKPDTYYLFNAYFFETYTKGIDQFDNTNNQLEYRYSGRELFNIDFATATGYDISDSMTETEVHNKVIFEEDVMPGDSYGYQKYFIQQVVAYESDVETGERTGNYSISDTFAQKELLSDYGEIIMFKDTNLSHNDLPYNAAQFTNDDLEISTKYIDLTKCKYYKANAALTEPDCSCGGGHICLYQKYGYCPYLFTTEKHCRKIRTLQGEKSNRFNLTQELSKVFEIYPIYWTEHYDNGKIVTDTVPVDEDTETITGKRTYERMRKKMFYIKEKGMENKLGFRYEKNLSNISRDIKSDQIVTKLYVSDVDSDLSKTGLCSIKTAEDNPSKDSFIINFDYYTTKGILNKSMVDADLYGKNEGDQGYLKQLGHLNTEYDKLSNLIINLQNASFNELQTNVDANTTAIEAVQQSLYKIKKQIDKYKAISTNPETAEQANAENKTYQSQIDKYNEQLNILNNLIFETFFDQVTEEYRDIVTGSTKSGRDAVMTFFDDMSIKDMKESPWFTQHTYNFGMLGQYNREYLQINEWKRQQSYYLKEINKLSLKFFRKYEPYLKEGTWTDDNYLSDNAYYFGAIQVAADGSIPKVSYNISVIDLYALPEYEDYLFNIADTTYVEDIGMFGINPITGLPNRLKVLISGITYNLDEPSKNSISVQNFTTQFADLFQQVTASVQSLSFNENIYKRASNFTSNQNINQDSLQGTLDTNNMKLINTDESNIKIDREGQSGSDINNHNNKYKLDGQGMQFSTNGGETWDVGVGPGGINADYIKVGTLDAGKIRIVDNNYLYFLWDSNGISAFRDPQSIKENTDNLFNDYALFNKYGLSLVEDGKIRLRAGYNFNGASYNPDPAYQTQESEWGKISSENKQGDRIGFYLYNTKGDEIFKTEAPSGKTTDAVDTARLSLKGEIFVTNERLSGAEAEQISRLPIYKITGGYNTILKVVNNFTITSDQYWTDKIAWEIGDTLTIDNVDYILDERNVSIQNYCLINNKLGKDYLVKIQLGYHKDGETEQIFEYLYPTLDETECYSKTSITFSVVVIDNYDSTTEAYTLNSNTNVETYSVYFQEDGVLNEVQNLTWYSIEDKKGYDKDGNKIIELPYVYWNRKINTGELTPTLVEDKTDAIGLFINNKISLDSTNQNTISNVYELNSFTDKRIFSCIGIKPDTEEVNQNKSNIFSILKNGNLFIGGDILYGDGTSTKNTEINSIPDIISIVNPKIKMTNDGQVSMDFNKFLDMEGESLTNTIKSAVNSIRLPRHSHSHELYVELQTVVPDLLSITYHTQGSPSIPISAGDQAIITEYLETYNVFSKADFIDRLKHDNNLSNLSIRSDPSIIIDEGNISISSWELRQIPVMGEIKEAGDGNNPGRGGPYLYDPIDS